MGRAKSSRVDVGRNTSNSSLICGHPAGQPNHRRFLFIRQTAVSGRKTIKMFPADDRETTDPARPDNKLIHINKWWNAMTKIQIMLDDCPTTRLLSWD
jgi:hypothetical protein